MNTLPDAAASSTLARTVLSKVPEATLAFWIIKITSTGMGEVVADQGMASIGVPLTAAITGVLMLAALVWQFRQDRYRPLPYWITVGTVALFGTAVGDGPRRGLNLSFLTTSIVFLVILALVLALWFYFERTLSIHTITTRRREVFYWMTVLVTFALGTAVGDLLTHWGLPFLVSAALLAALMAAFWLGWRFAKLNGVFAFWASYVMTRPLGASIADWSWVPYPNGADLGKPLAAAIFTGLFVVMLAFLIWQDRFRSTKAAARDVAP